MHKNEVSVFHEHFTEKETSIENSEINQIFDTAADGMRVIDKDFNVKLMNTTFCGLAGITMDEGLSQKCHETFSGPMCHTFECSLIQIMSGKERIERDVEKVHWNGDKIPCILTATPLRNVNGELIGIVEDFKDIRERKKLENDLLNAKNELELRVEERTQTLNKTIKIMQKEISKREKTEKALKKTEIELSFLSSKLLENQEDERRAIAFELHDAVIQSVAGIKYTLESIICENGNKFISADKQLMKAVGMTKNVIGAVLEITMSLWPANLEGLGLFAAISNFCREFELQYSRIHIQMKTNLNENDIPNVIKIVIYRIMQEAINNAAKHSHCNNVLFTLNKTNKLIRLIVEDNGIGFNEAEKNGKKGFGLLCMKERAELSGGSFSIKSVKGSGTIIRAAWVYRQLFENKRYNSKILSRPSGLLSKI